MNDMSPKAGIVIPAYNAEQFIEDCLRSALAQDYTNFRVYVLNDASTDSTAAIIENIASTSRGKLVWHTNPRDCPGGEACARQRATEMALDDGCEYIAPLDADDLRRPDSLTNQIGELESCPEAGVCYGRSDIINAKGIVRDNPGWEAYAEKMKGYPKGEVWSRLLAYGSLGRPSTVVLRATTARNCRYDPAFRYFADVDYLAQAATLREYSHFVPFRGIVGSYRFHANQAADRLKDSERLMLPFQTMQTISLRVFHRLAQQGRPVPAGRRRRIWRLLVLRTLARAVKQREWVFARSLRHDLLCPIRRLERAYRKAVELNALSTLLGVWGTAAPLAEDDECVQQHQNGPCTATCTRRDTKSHPPYPN